MSYVPEEGYNFFVAASDFEDAGNIERAIEFYLLSANLGYTPALTNLGNLYDDVVMPRNMEKAVECYKKAVKLGDGVGAYCLSVHFKNEKNFKMAKYWAKKSVKMGYENPLAEISA